MHLPYITLCVRLEWSDQVGLWVITLDGYNFLWVNIPVSFVGDLSRMAQI